MPFHHVHLHPFIMYIYTFSLHAFMLFHHIHLCPFVTYIYTFSLHASTLFVACIHALLSHASMSFRHMHPYLFVTCIHTFSCVHPHFFTACIHAFLSHASSPFHCMHPCLLIVCIHTYSYAEVYVHLCPSITHCLHSCLSTSNVIAPHCISSHPSPHCVLSHLPTCWCISHHVPSHFTMWIPSRAFTFIKSPNPLPSWPAHCSLHLTWHTLPPIHLTHAPPDSCHIPYYLSVASPIPCTLPNIPSILNTLLMYLTPCTPTRWAPCHTHLIWCTYILQILPTL